MVTHRIAMILGVYVTAGLGGCTETLSPNEEAPGSSTIVTRAGEMSTGERPDYGLRLVGTDSGDTAIYAFLNEGGGERAVLVDRCAKAEVDKVRLEGTLLPVTCDGQRIVVDEENGRLVLRKGGRSRFIGRLPA